MRRLLNMILRSIFFMSLYSLLLSAQEKPLPIIDMHLHALTADFQGPPPLPLCTPFINFPVRDAKMDYAEYAKALFSDTLCNSVLWSAETDEELMNKTLEILEHKNIYGVISGSELGKWMETNPKRLIPGLPASFYLGKGAVKIDTLKDWFKSGKVKVFGEIAIQYQGISPSDSLLDPYLSLAEEYDIPVGIHIGPGPPGAFYLGINTYRGIAARPLLLEEALIRHPNLRVYVMHAGWPMLDEMLLMLYSHPQLYVDIGVISFTTPRKEFHNYIRRIVEAGFGKRIMFGSDQMNWPEAILIAIDAIKTADFLSDNQKRDIFYNNAARFLRLTQEEISKHFGK